MGFTALDGLPMGTRTGQIDPGVVLYLITEKGMSPAEVQDFLYRDCGLKGLSGVSNDMRELLDSSDPHAAFAVDYFVYRVWPAGRHAGGGPAGPRRASSSPPASAKIPSAFGAGLSEKLEWLGCRLIRPRTPARAADIAHGQPDSGLHRADR